MLKFLKASLGLSESSLSPVLKHCISTVFEPKVNPFLKRIGSLVFGFKSIQMGLGWVVSDYGNDIKAVWHNGGTEGFSTIMAINPKKKTGCVVLTNKAFVNTYKFGVNLLKAIPE